MNIKYTREIMNKAKETGFTADSLVMKNLDEETMAKVSNDSRALVEIAMQEAGFTNKSSLKEVWDYSQSTMNDNNLFPVYVESVLRTIRDGNDQDIIYPKIIAGEMTISSDAYKGIYLDLGDAKNQKNLNWEPVEEGATIPTVSLVTGKQVLCTRKFAVGIKQTYETMRRIELPIVNDHFDFLARHFGSQNTRAVLKVMENGDGNGNAIPTAMKKETAATTLSAKDLIDFALDFFETSNGLTADTYICTKGMYAQLLSTFFNNENVNGFAPGATFTFPQNILNGATVIFARELDKTSDGSERMLAVNVANGVRKLVEAGSMINEQDTKIDNQTIIYTLSENTAYQKISAYSVGELKLKKT